MSAKVSTFSRGVTFVSSGETGTQANEFEAAIKSVTSSTTVGAVFVYDTRNDSDGGAWRKKCAGLSWFDEDLNTATRGGRREFPSVALLVLDEESAEETLTIYDLDDPAMPMWMQFLDAGALKWSTSNARSFNAVTALNGRIYVGFQDGLVEFDFATDHTKIGFSGPRYLTSGTAIADRNVTATFETGGDGYTIANIVVNDVAATIVEGSEIGALGLPIPTVAVATGGGVSVIHPNGSVYDFKDSTATNRSYSDVRFRESGDIFAWSSMNGTAHSWYANQLYSNLSAASDLFKYDEGDNANLPNLLSDSTQTIEVGKGSVFTGGDNGLSIVKENLANPVEGASAHITSTYNTGYMLGDIRFATTTTQTANLNNGAYVYDQSVKNNTLTVNADSGSYITRTKVATDAEMSAFSNFSADNYLSRAYDPDFDFGTGDFSIMFWCKLADTVNTTETVLERAYGGNAFFNVDFQNGIPRLIAYNGSAYDTTTGTRDLSDNQWHQLMCFRKNGVVYIYIDGKQHVSNAMTYDLDNSQAILHIGQTTGNGNPLANGSLSLLRISATAPTPQQVKEIYEAEAPLFRAGAKCLLSQVSFNDVNDLAYDNSSDLLYVGTKSGDAGDSVSTFRGLERVDTKDGQDLGWDGASANLVAAAGGVVGYARTGGTGGLVLDLPAIDVRGDINTADTKLPDDGKFHFTGVTTNATPTVIGQIPIAENEGYTVIARVMGLRYNTADSSVRHFCEIKQQFTRRIGGDVVEETQISKLEEGDWAALDVDLDYDTGADTIRVKVTGDGSGPYRVVWKAEVEVQRITEKQYER
jgi:hypothetical protein